MRVPNPRLLRIIPVICVICVICGLKDPALGADKTNVVFILTDNHGAWTLGCYGNPDIRTPHIDRLAAEGLRFSRAFCNNAVCSPTRATYLTGLMPSQHGVHNFLSGGRLQVGPEARNTLEEFTSLPEILKAEGYLCGLVGKWHLGDNLHPQEGLDDYWITMPHGGTSTFHNAQVIENGEMRKEPKYLTQLWTEHACNFIESSMGHPFFLFLAYNGPYGLSRYQLESSGNRHAEYYADKALPSFPRGAIHPWQFSNREYFGNPVSIRRYAEELSAIDDGVGAVMQKLEDCGLAGETLVVFAADQGWAGGQHGLWGMGDHTRPVNAREHSMHIPMIFHHRANREQSAPGIPGGRVSDLMVSNYDFLPSVLGYLGLEHRIPPEAISNDPAPIWPGRNFSAVLRGEEIADWDNTVYFEYENLRCIRTQDWKFIERFEDGYDELYHLADDPGERKNLIDDEAAAKSKAQLKKRLDAFFARHSLPKYDLWHGGGSQTLTHVWGKEAAQPRAGAAGKSERKSSVLDPSVDVPPMRLPEGLMAEVAAAPPLTRHPMMANFDDRGRLFVAEAAGVNLNSEELDKQTPNFIRMLEDSNGDGLFDRSTVFADHLTFPSGALWHEGALWVTAAPSIWRLEDTDDDGVADKREAMVTGFGYTGNAADLHGPFLHPNGRIFWCHGRKDLDVRDKDGRLIHKGKGARIWSCEPDGSDVQIYAGGGMDNPVEIDFTPEGEIIGSINLFYGRPRGDVLVHWLYGGAYPRFDQEAVLAEFTRTGDLLTEFYNFGHVAVSGMARYRARGGLGEFEGDLFTSLFNTQRITRTVIEAAGPTFAEVRTEDFLVIDDPDVHLTDVLEDADGTLLVIDTGGWFRNGCPASQIAKPEIAGAIYRVRRAGPFDQKSDPRGMAIDWEGANPAALAALLGDDRFAVRDRAIAELAGRGDASLRALEKALESKSLTARQNAVWSGTRLGTAGAKDLVRKALGDREASVRHATCNGVWRTRDPKAVTPLVALLNDVDPAVQMAAARALGRIGDAAAVDALLKFLGRIGNERELEHAAIYSLIEINDYAATERGLDREAMKSRVNWASQLDTIGGCVLWALDGMNDSRLGPKQVVEFLAADSAVKETAVEICKRHPEWAHVIASTFIESWGSERFARPDLNPFEMRVPAVDELASFFLADEDMRSYVGRYLNHPDANWVGRAFRIIAQSPQKVPLHEDWIDMFEEGLAQTDEKLLTTTLTALAKIDTNRFDNRLRAIGDDPSQPTLTRVKAIAAASEGAGTLSPAALALLTEMFTSGEAGIQRVEAARMLAEAKLSAKQRLEVAKLAAVAGPVELPVLLGVFEAGRDPETGLALVAALRQSEALGSIRAADLQRILSRYPPEVNEKAQSLVRELLALAEQREQRLAELKKEFNQGDAARGKAVYLAGKGACLTCHQVGGNGRAVGPDLSRIGRIRTEADLLESILYPSSTLARDFEPYQIELADGQVHFGIIQKESADTVYLLDAAGIPRPLARGAIKEIRPGAVSLMPQGLEQTVSREELIDIVAYLKSLQ